MPDASTWSSASRSPRSALIFEASGPALEILPALVLLAALVGAGLGVALGAATAGLLAPTLGIMAFEGASGDFAVFVGLVSGALLVLRRGGDRSLKCRK